MTKTLNVSKEAEHLMTIISTIINDNINTLKYKYMNDVDEKEKDGILAFKIVNKDLIKFENPESEKTEQIKNSFEDSNYIIIKEIYDAESIKNAQSDNDFVPIVQNASTLEEMLLEANIATFAHITQSLKNEKDEDKETESKWKVFSQVIVPALPTVYKALNTELSDSELKFFDEISFQLSNISVQ